MYQKILTAAILTVCAWLDIRYRKVYGSVILVYILFAAAGHLACGETSILVLGAGLVPGVICLLISLISREALGFGDSILILASGFSLGLQTCAGLVIWAFFLSGFWALLLLCRSRTNRRKEFPFVPFLLVGIFLQEFMIG